MLRIASKRHSQRPLTDVEGNVLSRVDRVVDVDFSPLRQQLLNGLLDFRWVSPGDRLQKLGQTALVARQVEPELPYEVLLFRSQRLAGSVVENLLREAKNNESRRSPPLQSTLKDCQVMSSTFCPRGMRGKARRPTGYCRWWRIRGILCVTDFRVLIWHSSTAMHEPARGTSQVSTLHEGPTMKYCS